MNWQDYKSDFEWEGSLQDIYVLNTTITDWQRLIDFLRMDSYQLSYKLGSENATLPQNVTKVFQARREMLPLMSVDIGGLILNCHFFTDVEIEFDVDPREVCGESEFQKLLDFMREVAQLLDKDVILTPENMQDKVILTVHPEGD